jgi:ATP synthase subunit 6
MILSLLFLLGPLEQFQILYYFSIIPYVLEISNLLITLIFYSLLILPIIYFIIKTLPLFPTYFQIFIESFYILIENTLISNGTLKNQHHMALLKTLTFILLLCNLIGMIPYQFTVTSHIFITFLLSFIIFIGLNYIAMTKYKKKYFALFLPSGTPFPIAPILLLIEIISFYSRVFSLAIRLFANLMSGHTLLGILTSFLFSAAILGSIYFFISLIPSIILLVIIGLELAIAIVQVYVFITLTCLYIYDLYYIGH